MGRPGEPGRRARSAGWLGLTQGRPRSNSVSGGDFGPGTPYEAANVASTYMRQILGFIGITDVNVLLAGGTLAIDRGERTMTEFVEQFECRLSLAEAA